MLRLARLLPLALPTAALAHAGDHGQTGFGHVLTEPDHLALIALGLALVLGLALGLRGRR